MAEASGARTHRREWVINIKRDLEPYVKTTTSFKRKRPILRVGSRLRELRREQFVPEHLFVGLYHMSSYDHNDHRFKGNNFKLSIVGAFLADSGKSLSDWGEISARIVEDPTAMLEKYNEDGLDDFSKEDVQSVLAMDAIVLAWLCTSRSLYSFQAALRDLFPSVFYVIGEGESSFEALRMLDILKLENQIPLELIQNALLLFFEIFNNNVNQRLVSIASRRDIGDARTQGDLEDDVGSDESFEIFSNNNGKQRLESTASRRDIGDARTQADLEDDVGSDESFEIFNNDYGKQRLESTASRRDSGDARTQADELFQYICTSVALISSGLPGFPLTIAINVDVNQNFDNCEHLLHCVYLHLISEPLDQTELRVCAAPDSLCGRLHRALKYRFNRRNTPGQRAPPMSVIPVASASQLRKAGINFRGKEGLEVKFEKHLLGATLYLPRIDYVGDSSEALWRNLLAFEDQYAAQHPFMSYLCFMDDLIDLEEDVALLRHGRNPVIASVGIGSNAEIARIFNSMTTDYFHTAINDNWNSVRGQVLDYYNNKARQIWVEFRRTNFGKPWLIASLLAAIALLILTFLQTLFAILAYKYTF